MRQPLVIADDAVELIAVEYQQTPPIGRDMDVVAENLHAVEVAAVERPQSLVVIAGNEDHSAPVFRPSQDFPDNLVMGRRPVPASFQTPSVDNVADKINLLGIGVIKKIEK